MQRRLLLPFLWIVLCVAALPVAALAHSMYQAAVLLDFSGSAINIELQLPMERLQAAVGTSLTRQTVARDRTRITEYILSRVSATLPDSRQFGVEELVPPDAVSIEGSEYVIAHLSLIPPVNANPNLFALHCDVLVDRIPSQVALVSIRSDWRTNTFANNPQLLGVIRASDRSITIDRRDGSWWRGFGSIFQLGIRHIAEGTDHLLFLLVLLLPAPLTVLRGRWSGRSGLRRCLLKMGAIVTAFTIGHSATLAAGAFNLVHLPARPIEVLIAVSILVSAVHALRPIFPGCEAVVAGCFGLVHGLAFATTLSELGLGRWERVASIFSFNLGIEVMQLVVVVMAMPSLLLLGRTAIYSAIRIPGAVFAGTAAAGWIGERLANLPNPVDPLVTALAQRAVWVAAGLFLFCAITWSFTRIYSTFHFSSTAIKDNYVELQ